MKFREFIVAAADHLGRQHLPVRDAAHEIDEFVGPDSVHDELAPKLVRAIYRANRCGHLDATIRATPTFDVLGAFHGRLLRDKRTDLEQVRFVQGFGDLTSTLLLAPADRMSTPPAPDEGRPELLPDDSGPDDQGPDNDDPNNRGQSLTSAQRRVIQFQR